MGISRKQAPPRKRKAPRKRKEYKRPQENAVIIGLLESCRYTGFGSTSTRQKARAGKLPGAFFFNDRWYVHKGKLLNWLNSLGTESAA